MNRYDIAYFFDVTDGNPNGDPDAGNLPRVDVETGQGLVTDVCLKRKIRNYVGMVKGEQPPHEIYVKERAVLNAQHDRAWQKVDPKAKPADKKKLPKDAEKARALTRFMCDNFFDIRAFGAVMTTEVNCGQVRGPIQFGIARSLDPIVSLEHAVTRCAVTNERDLEKERTIGRKFSVPYALYRVHAFVNPMLADGPRGTGFSDDDLELFKTALAQMFEYDRSAARGLMAPRACIAFRHESPLGNARADQLFERVTCVRKTPDQADRPPRSFQDYELRIAQADLPQGISVERWV
jgi:CRISPR-associated protein Csd2